MAGDVETTKEFHRLNVQIPTMETTHTVRRACRNVKRWRTASMALRWTASAMLEAKKGFRKLKAYKQLPALRIALKAHYEKASSNGTLAQQTKAA